LSPSELRFFRQAEPLGFILFARNCETPDQVRALTAALRGAVGRADAPVLIDQEGGRVARLRPPHWWHPPAAGQIAALWPRDRSAARRAAYLCGRLIAYDLRSLGITVDCAPVLDLPVPGADQVIGDRAFGLTPEPVAALGRALCEGLLAGGVLPVIKHLPGHGRATADSHLALPVVNASHALLRRTDFAPFRALADMPIGMTAHLRYDSIDPRAPASLSAIVVQEVIRREIGFDGLLLSDDLAMAALSGSQAERAQGALAAGCDVVLHCNGRMEEMVEIAGAAGPLRKAAERRLKRALARSVAPHQAFNQGGARSELEALLKVFGP
jgi:beta-N-acetylhexosaminidase